MNPLKLTKLKKWLRDLRHRSGFHGPNWYPFWMDGNVWTECGVCGARRMPSFADASEIPAFMIEQHSRLSTGG